MWRDGNQLLTLTLSIWITYWRSFQKIFSGDISFIPVIAQSVFLQSLSCLRYWTSLDCHLLYKQLQWPWDNANFLLTTESLPNCKNHLCGPHFCLSLRALTMVVNIAHWWATRPIPFGAFSVPPWKVNYQLEESWGFSTTCHRNSMATSVQSARDYMHLGKPGVLSFILGLFRLVTKALPGSLLAEGYFWNEWMLMY